MLKLKNIALIGASALAVTAASTVTAQAQPWRDYNRPAYGQDYNRPAYSHDYNRPAYGHDYNRPSYGHEYVGQVDYRLTPANLDRLSARVNQAARSGAISRGWAINMQRDLASLRPTAWRAQQGRASGWEVRRLSDTVNRIDAQTQRFAYNDRRDWRDYHR